MITSRFSMFAFTEIKVMYNLSPSRLRVDKGRFLQYHSTIAWIGDIKAKLNQQKHTIL